MVLTHLLPGFTKVSDAGLARLKGMAELEWLGLVSTGISGAGFVHLEGMKGLEELWLNFTSVTDAGLAHLKGMNRLTRLFLLGTHISDTGLAHLEGMTGLRDLNLGSRELQDLIFTDAGLEKLRDALPKCKIIPAKTETSRPLPVRGDERRRFRGPPPNFLPFPHGLVDMEEFEKGLKMISEELPKRIADEANPDPVPAETDDLQEPAEEKTAPGQTSPPDPDAPVIIDIVVEFRGGARIKEESVLAKMKTKAGDRLDSQVLDEDFKRLYEISPVENVTLLGEPLGDGIRLIFRIEAAEN